MTEKGVELFLYIVICSMYSIFFVFLSTVWEKVCMTTSYTTFELVIQEFLHCVTEEL